MTISPYHFISTPAAWQQCLDNLRREPRLALDLEANSLHAYRETVCLIQLSTARDDYIVDPRAGLDLSGLGELGADPAIEKALHAAEYDLILMKREYGWEMNHLFDTMWAARILGYQEFGLANLVQRVFGVTLDKRHQRADWCRRPLTPDQLAYAQSDTHYLLPLRDLLAAEVQAAGRWCEAQELFVEQCQVEISDNTFDPESFWTINGVQYLDGRQQAVLRALAVYRDEEARRRDLPLFKVLANKTLLEIARAQPRTLSDLGAVYGMSAGQLRRYGRGLLRAVEEAQRAPLPKRPRGPKRPSDAVLRRYDALQNWRKEVARARGVESDVILSRRSMWNLARADPKSAADLEQIESLGEWRRLTYGEEILKVLR